MAIAGFASDGVERMVAVGRYCGEVGQTSAETAVTVHDDFQGRGIGKFLVDHLAGIARQGGLKASIRAADGLRMARVRAVLSQRGAARHRPDGLWLTMALEDDGEGGGLCRPKRRNNEAGRDRSARSACSCRST